MASSTQISKIPTQDKTDLMKNIQRDSNKVQADSPISKIKRIQINSSQDHPVTTDTVVDAFEMFKDILMSSDLLKPSAQIILGKNFDIRNELDTSNPLKIISKILRLSIHSFFLIDSVSLNTPPVKAEKVDLMSSLKPIDKLISPARKRSNSPNSAIFSKKQRSPEFFEWNKDSMVQGGIGTEHEISSKDQVSKKAKVELMDSSGDNASCSISDYKSRDLLLSDSFLNATDVKLNFIQPFLGIGVHGMKVQVEDKSCQVSLGDSDDGSKSSFMLLGTE